jgi:hypothetical protein
MLCANKITKFGKKNFWPNPTLFKWSLGIGGAKLKFISRHPEDILFKIIFFTYQGTVVTKTKIIEEESFF